MSDLLEQMYDMYAREGKIEFFQEGRRYRVQAEDGSVFLMRKEDILIRFKTIQEGVAYLAALRNIQLID